MWSKVFAECLEAIVMKPYLDIRTVDITTVSKSMYKQSVIISLLIEFFFVSKIVF